MLAWEFPPHIHGGLGIACHGLATALAQDHHLRILLPGPAPQDSPLQLIGLDPHSQKTPLNAYEEELYCGDLLARVESYTRAALHYLSSHALEDDFDLIHAHDWMTARAGLAIQEATGKPLVFHIHSLSYDRSGPEDQGPIYQIEKEIISRAQMSLCVSDYTRGICLTQYGANPEKIFTVHNGAAPQTPFRSTPLLPEKIVLFLGRLSAQKAPHSFLKIAAKILAVNPKVRFILAGAGEQLSELIEESITQGIADRVHFLGFQNRSQVLRLFSQSDVCCMPSRSEPFGLAALEAAQFGVPIVVSKQSGIREVLPSALVTDSWDLDGMAAHIQSLLNDEALHQETSQALLAEQKTCTWEKAARKIEELYLTKL